ncbi:YolD-like family protein [Bacillus sp. 03113]|uniref:YolD-like family protein n=1 Tax=Bacillus sp. 03113 TaxID=2578211 RepID=UPI001143E4AD|nr:YolD-like family protein [Bacillus sp. 03113]
MINDRGKMKWQSAFMLPEHIKRLKQVLLDEEKVNKPLLDECKIEQIELLILEGIEFDWTLKYTLYDDGFITEIKGKTHFIDHFKKELRIKDEKGTVHYISFYSIIDVQKF